MRKNIKHKFAHQDPEKTTEKVSKTSDASPKKKSDEYGLVKKDLKRTAVTIALFIILIVALYIIKDRTDWFSIIISKILK